MKKDEYDGVVAPLQGLAAAESGGLHAGVGLWHVDHVVELQCLRAFLIWYAHLHLCVGVLGARYRLDHFAEKHRASHHDVHVDESEHLDILHLCAELGGGVAGAALVGVDGVGGFGDPRYACVDVAGSPWGSSEVAVRLILGDGGRRSDFIDFLLVSADDDGFGYSACDPLLKVAVTDFVDGLCVSRISSGEGYEQVYEIVELTCHVYVFCVWRCVVTNGLQK